VPLTPTFTAEIYIFDRHPYCPSRFGLLVWKVPGSCLDQDKAVLTYISSDHRYCFQDYVGVAPSNTPHPFRPQCLHFTSHNRALILVGSHVNGASLNKLGINQNIRGEDSASVTVFSGGFVSSAGRYHCNLLFPFA
jgi:hypothetical protein